MHPLMKWKVTKLDVDSACPSILNIGTGRMLGKTAKRNVEMCGTEQVNFFSHFDVVHFENMQSVSTAHNCAFA